MHRFSPVVIVIAFLLAAFRVSAQEATPETTPIPEITGPGGYTIQQPYDGQQRVYRLYIPENYTERGEPLPVIFVLHGAGGTGLGIASFSGFNELAEREGFIAVYPDGLGNAWNDGRNDPRLSSIDDVGFIETLIDYLTANLNVNSERIYATGYSMGGMLSFRLGCELHEKIAAVASVASTMPEYLVNTCLNNGEPIPVLVIQGTDDGVIPWVGVRGGYLSTGDTVRVWNVLNECEGASTIEPLPDTDPDDGTRTLVETYTDCADNAEVGLYGVYFGGHTWPGHPIEAPFELGLTSLDFNAEEAIWEFFERHPL